MTRYLDEILADRPLGVWPLNDSDLILRDATILQRNGTWESGADDAVPGPIMPGPSPHIPLSRHFGPTRAASILNAGNVWMEPAAATFEIWAYHDSAFAAEQYLMTRGNASGGSTSSYLFNVTAAGLLRGRYYNGATARSVTGATAMVPGRWYHCVAALGAGTSRVYLNGVQDGSASTTLGANPGGTGLLFGRDGTGTDSVEWDGSLAFAAMYDYQLSAARVSAHYAAGLSRASTRIWVPGVLFADVAVAATAQAATGTGAANNASASVAPSVAVASGFGGVPQTVAFESKTELDQVTNSTTWVLSKPSGTIEGSFLLAHLANQNDARTIVGVPSGWTLLDSSVSTDNPHQALVYYKVAGGSEPSTYTWTWDASSGSNGTGTIERYSGVDPLNPIGAHSVRNVDAVSLVYDSENVLPTRDRSLLASFISMDAGAAAVSPQYTPEGGWTERFDYEGTNSDVMSAGGDKLESDTNKDGISWTGLSNIQSIVFIVEIRAVGVLDNPTAVASIATNALADAATGTGLAPNAAVSVAPNAAASTGTGTANQATGNVQPNSEAGTGTGAANNPSASLQTNVEAAQGSAAAGGPTSSVAPNAGVATGTGAANDATVTVSVATDANAEAAQGTGAANNITADIKVNAAGSLGVGNALDAAGAVQVHPDAAVATGVALDATVSTEVLVSVSAEAATGTGSANNASISIQVDAEASVGLGIGVNPSASIAPNAEATAGTGVANSPSPSLQIGAGAGTGSGVSGGPSSSVVVNAGVATGTGTANNATVTTLIEVFANAEAATGVGAAGSPSGSVSPNAGTGAGAGSANAVSVSIQVDAEVASGTGQALDATIATGDLVDAGVATGVGQALNPSIEIMVNALAAAGVGEAFDATVNADIGVRYTKWNSQSELPTSRDALRSGSDDLRQTRDALRTGQDELTKAN